MVRAGILRCERDGNRVYYQPDPSCPFLQELRGIFVKTAGLADILRGSLAPFSHDIQVAFIYGSIARGQEVSSSDVDLLIVGDVQFKELAVVLKEAEKTVRRSVNPAIYSPAEFARNVCDINHFLLTVLQSEKLFLQGGQDELEAACSGATSLAAHDQ
jgi:predicted nucleotidyltransferase